MEPFRWTPDERYTQHARVGQFMRAHGIDSYEDLVTRSQADIEWFWDAIVSHLGIEFSKPYREVLDTQGGIEWPLWFSGGQINLAQNTVDRWARESPEARAIVWEGEDGRSETLSYRRLREEVDAFAAGLKRLGIGKGDAVGIYMPMIPQNPIAIYACSKLGVIWLPIFSGFSAQAVASRLEDAGAVALIAADAFPRRGKLIDMQTAAVEACRDVESVQHLIIYRHSGVDLVDAALDWESVREVGEAVEPLALDPEHPLFIAYTSGTTGKPKGVVHVHGGFLVKIAQEVAHQVDLHADELLFWVTDMGWIMGPWETIGAHANGAAVMLYDGAPDHPANDRLWAIVEKHQVTTLGVSPTLVRALMPHGEEPVRAHDLSSLRILASTGEPWNPEPWEWFFRVVGGERCPIINLSGGTEVGACFLSPTPLVPLRPCSLGLPSLGMVIDVVDPNDATPLAPGEIGELVCRKPWPGMTRGIWGDPDRYIETYWSRFPGIWVHGDWASRDEEGYWYLHGRSDDTLKIAGKRLGPADVESLLVADPAVVEAAAVGVPDEVKGEKVWAFVVLGKDVGESEDLRDRLKGAVAQGLGKAFTPDRIAFVDALPKTRSAKIVRRAVRAVALGEDPGDVSSLEDPSSLDAVKAAR
jgi:acetyl-CoA synthetase